MALTLDDLETAGKQLSCKDDIAFCEAIIALTGVLAHRPAPVVIIIREK